MRRVTGDSSSVCRLNEVQSAVCVTLDSRGGRDLELNYYLGKIVVWVDVMFQQCFRSKKFRRLIFRVRIR